MRKNKSQYNIFSKKTITYIERLKKLKKIGENHVGGYAVCSENCI